MAVKIAALDYRADQTLLDSQTSTINTFLADKTVTKLVVCDEYIMAHYTTVPPVTPHKVKAFRLTQGITENGISSTETTLNNFIAANVTALIQDPIALDNGTIIFVYR